MFRKRIRVIKKIEKRDIYCNLCKNTVRVNVHIDRILEDGYENEEIWFICNKCHQLVGYNDSKIGVLW